MDNESINLYSILIFKLQSPCKYALINEHYNFPELYFYEKLFAKKKCRKYIKKNIHILFDQYQNLDVCGIITFKSMFCYYTKRDDYICIIITKNDNHHKMFVLLDKICIDVCIGNDVNKYLIYDEPIEQINRKLDETTAILRDTIDSLLERGVQIDSLYEHTQELYDETGIFHGETKKLNSCCWLY